MYFSRGSRTLPVGLRIAVDQPVLVIVSRRRRYRSHALVPLPNRRSVGKSFLSNGRIARLAGRTRRRFGILHAHESVIVILEGGIVKATATEVEIRTRGAAITIAVYRRTLATIATKHRDIVRPQNSTSPHMIPS